MQIGENGHSKKGERKVANKLYISIIIAVVVAYLVVLAIGRGWRKDQVQDVERQGDPQTNEQTQPEFPTTNTLDTLKN